MTDPKEYLKDVFRPLLDVVAFSHVCAGIDTLEYEKAQVVASDVQEAFACLPEAIEELNAALDESSADSGLTMATGPDFGEVGYIGDYPQPLEYPCNCVGCTEEWRAEEDDEWGL